MSETSDYAARMHRLLDTILEARRSLQRSYDEMTESDACDLSNDAIDIFTRAADLMAELVGDEVSTLAFGAFPETDDSDRFRWIAMGKFAQKLTYLTPILGSPNWEWWVSQAIDDISLMHTGDDPLLLTPASRRTGQKRFPGRIALLRVQALQWQGFLKLKGFCTHERNNLVASAYRTDAETIRKWRKSCEKILGESDVQWRLEAARRHSWASSSFVAVDKAGKSHLTEKGWEALQANGDAYWQLSKKS